jgi:lipopolysaccharide transport system permease protein
MNDFSISARSLARSLVTNRDVLVELVKREISARYKGSVLGLVWSFVTPLLMMAVYTFVFSVVFKARWSTESQSKTEFALVLFAGLMVFNLFSETISRAPFLIQSSANYVKKVVFPLEILPVVSLGGSLFHLSVNFLVWLLFYICFVGAPPLTVGLFIFIITPLVFFTLGLSWFLASLGVYVRDIGQVIGVLVSVLLFMSPIFYPLSSLPTPLKPWLAINPITQVVEGARDVLLWGVVPSVPVYLAYLLSSFIVAWLGYAWFQKTRKGFADVI